jgi:hypothetical protein
LSALDNPTAGKHSGISAAEGGRTPLSTYFGQGISPTHFPLKATTPPGVQQIPPNPAAPGFPAKPPAKNPFKIIIILSTMLLSTAVFAVLMWKSAREDLPPQMAPEPDEKSRIP